VLGKRPQITIFGTDYLTRDGTCIRDYIHVSDLVDLHLRALERLAASPTAGPAGRHFTVNCGYGHGCSVREVIETVELVSATRLNVCEAERRAGDPVVSVADTTRRRQLFPDWQPRFDDLALIVKTTLDWG
jgi:UDP-glucose 4-epimerase